MKSKKYNLCLALAVLLMTGCTVSDTTNESVADTTTQAKNSVNVVTTTDTPTEKDNTPTNTTTTVSETVYDVSDYQPDTDFLHLKTAFPDLDLDAASWSGESAYVTVNDNIPFFSEEDKSSTNVWEEYSELDELGRCGTAYANVCVDLMPTEERGNIGQVKPSGWQTAKYDKSIISDMYLFNRCHLIAYMLAGENANENNLITGTRYLNMDGMLTFETLVDDYIEDNPNNHVLYRVTPMYKNNDLVAQGVLMEGWSQEDNGEGVSYCAWCYNVQPYITIDYLNGNNHLSGEEPETPEEALAADTYTYSYVLNENSKKIHRPDCSAVDKIAKDNRTETNRTYDELVSQGYEPCGICHPN